MYPEKIARMSNPRELVNQITSSDKYLEGLHHKESSSDVRTAFANTALYLANGPEVSLLSSQELTVVSLLPKYLDAEDRLSNDAYRYASSEERQVDLDHVVPLNHALRELIDSNKRLTMPAVKDFVAGIMMLTEGPVKAQHAKEYIGAILNGMRHEIAAENAFWQINPEVENVRQATTEEDKHGVDLVVTYSGREVSYDIKASQESADRANLKNTRYGYTAMYSGFQNEDFGNGFRASDTATSRLIPYYKQMLDYSVDQSKTGLHIA